MNNQPETLSIAQRCKDAPDQLEMARSQEGYKGRPSPDILRFHFEDNSYLDFQITYTAASVGRILEDGR